MLKMAGATNPVDHRAEESKMAWSRGEEADMTETSRRDPACRQPGSSACRL